MDCSLPGSSVHGILHTRTLQWVAISFSRGSSQSRPRTWISCIGRWEASMSSLNLERRPFQVPWDFCASLFCSELCSAYSSYFGLSGLPHPLLQFRESMGLCPGSFSLCCTLETLRSNYRVTLSFPSLSMHYCVLIVTVWKPLFHAFYLCYCFRQASKSGPCFSNLARVDVISVNWWIYVPSASFPLKLYTRVSVCLLNISAFFL